MRKNSGFPLAVFTDVAFLLLLFFLVLAVTSNQLPTSIDPPKEDFPAQDLSDVLTIVVSQDGDIYFLGELTTVENIPYATVYALLSDEKTPFRILSPIIEQLRAMGVETLHCLVECSP